MGFKTRLAPIGWHLLADRGRAEALITGFLRSPSEIILQAPTDLFPIRTQLRERGNTIAPSRTVFGSVARNAHISVRARRYAASTSSADPRDRGRSRGRCRVGELQTGCLTQIAEKVIEGGLGYSRSVRRRRGGRGCRSRLDGSNSQQREEDHGKHSVLLHLSSFTVNSLSGAKREALHKEKVLSLWESEQGSIRSSPAAASGRF